MSETILVEREGPIVTLLFNRPQAFNAFDLELVSGLSEQLTRLAMDDTVRGIIISGEGKAFCAGGDLKWALGWPQGAPAAFHTLAARLHAAVLEMRRMPKPVIAAINGIAAGAGFSIALACDFRVMARSAALRQAYTSNGLCIDGGGTFMLPRLVGLARALEIAAFDRPISSAQALEWGLITQIVEDGNAREGAKAMARELAAKSMHSLGWSKQLLTDSFDATLETQLEHERAGLSDCAGHPDGQEGLAAFSEKRKPVFG